MNFVDALLDESLLGATFKQRGGKSTWKPWCDFGRIIYGLPLDPEGLKLFTKCTSRTTPPTTQAREVYCIAGRRSGKTKIAAALAVFNAALVDYSDVTVPGETILVPCIAGTREQAGVALSYVKSHFSASPTLRALVVEETKAGVKLRTGIELSILSADPATLRGRAVPFAVIDEGAFITNASEILEALRPAMIQFPSPMLLTISSPFSRRGALFQAYEKHFGRDGDTLIWKSSSRTMNRTLSRAAIAAALLRDPIAARSEYFADFRRDLSGFLDEALVDAATVRERKLLTYKKQFSYTSFVDVSGGRADSLALAIAHRDGDKIVLDLLFEKTPPFSPQAAIAEAAEILKHFHVYEVTGDKYAANFVSDAFTAAGIRYVESDKDRSAIYTSALPLFTSGIAELLDVSKLRSQLCALERRAGRLKDTIDHPPNGHDDLSNAVCGALALAADNAHVLGVLDLAARTGWDGFVDFVDNGNATETPRESLAARQVRVMREMLSRRKEFTPPPNPLFAPPPTEPCPKCGSTLVVQLTKWQQHCNSCAAELFREPVRVVVAGRDGIRTRQLDQ